MPDAIELLTQDHQTVNQLFSQVGAGHGDRSQAMGEIIRELSIHAAVEEQVLYPVMRSQLPNGDDVVRHALDEHQQVKETLAQIERCGLDSAEATELVQTLMTAVRAHVEEEEGQLFPQLRQHVGADKLNTIGDTIEMAKKMAPTHPHPKAPNTPPGNIVAGTAAGIFDRMRDVVDHVLGDKK